MTLDELTSSIRGAIEHGLRQKGYPTTVTVVFQGEGRFFASSPTKVPFQVWEDVLHEQLYQSRWPMTVRVDGPESPT